MNTIAEELAGIAREPRIVRRDVAELVRESPASEKDFEAILELVRSSTVASLKQAGLGDYLRHLRENPDEAHSLAQDILIRVTQFFRDPERLRL